jgi:DNA-binding HxlR family transcriptional regulator
MPTTRSYRDRCPIARALDVVGERWALLVVRELLLGPQRFSDLRRALPGASSNMLTDRLRELERRGVICRGTLPPPAASAVYELTERGRALEPVLDALGSWGAGEPPPEPSSLNASSVLLFLRGSLRDAAPVQLPVLTLRLEDRTWTICGAGNDVEIEPGETTGAQAELTTDPETLNRLVLDPGSLDSALGTGAASIDGELDALRDVLALAAGSSRSRAGS